MRSRAAPLAPKVGVGSTVIVADSPHPARVTRNSIRTFGGADRIRTGDGGFANLCLTTWLRRREAQVCIITP